jgi:hypothetical protein
MTCFASSYRVGMCRIVYTMPPLPGPESLIY